MWKENVLKKIESAQSEGGSVSFRTQSEINQEQNDKLRDARDDFQELNKIHLEFHRLAGVR
jgi:hypothetical protein